MDTLGMTHSACGTCRAVVPAKVLTDGRKVYFRKFCPEHGEEQRLVCGDVADYLRSQRYVKPAWVPLEFSGDSTVPCPEGCGFCDRHEQHLCMPIVEITSRCDLACPICLVDAGRPWDMTLAEFRRLLDRVIRAERRIHVLNLSGGEPLLHPDLLAFVAEAASRPEIVRVSISTNGLRLRVEPKLLRALHEMDVCISLQLDGFEEKAYEVLRGRPLLREKLEILRLLEEENVTTSLTMTAAGGVNDGQFRPMLDQLFSHEHIVSMMIQPAAFEGRGARMASRVKRLTLPDVVRALGEARHPAVTSADFVHLPCSHPQCFSLAFYLMLSDGRGVAVNQLIEAAELMDTMSNRIFYGLAPDEYDHLKQMVYEVWSGPAGSRPDADEVIQTVRELLRRTSCCLDPRTLFTAAERRVKSIFIHAFQDADTFDLARVRRCCTAYVLPDGRLAPACAFNVLHRHKAARPLAARREIPTDER